MLQDGERETHGVERETHTSTIDWEMRRELPLREVNNPLDSADTDDGSHGERSTHRSPGQSSERVELWPHSSGGKSMGDGELQTRRPEDEPQEHIEQSLHESREASREHGEHSTHAPNDDCQ